MRRSIYKAITWRACGSLATVMISFALTKNFVLAGQIGLLDTLFKIAAYYVHEELWERRC